MFKSLSDRLTNSLKSLKNQASLTEENVKSALRDVRIALLEADVALSVVKDFIANVKDKAYGQKVVNSLTPSQAFLSIIKEELINVLGSENQALNLSFQPPVVILMAGLQGAGKTTTTAKLAKFLCETEKKKVMVVSTDVYRPAAIKQLETLAGQLPSVEYYSSNANQNPVDIAVNALDAAKKSSADVLIVDTAGRLHVDKDMMTEIQTIHAQINAHEVLFIIDSMTGQDAAITAKSFDDSLPLSGVVLTKTDGDARGGAALSIRKITGKPIKFIGSGEKNDALEPFYPDRIASRILGMGDMLTLIDEAKKQIDHKDAENLTKKLKAGKSFTLVDFKQQMIQMKKMGGADAIMGKLPGMGNMSPKIQDNLDDKMFIKMEAMIDSMTPWERRKPEFIKSSRRIRITKGSGTTVQDLNKMLKQFEQMRKMMKKMSQKGGIRKMMSAMKGMRGMGNNQQLISSMQKRK